LGGRLKKKKKNRFRVLEGGKKKKEKKKRNRFKALRRGKKKKKKRFRAVKGGITKNK
jgi:hypothetical protein